MQQATVTAALQTPTLACRLHATHSVLPTSVSRADGSGSLTFEARIGKCSLLHTQQCGVRSWWRMLNCARWLDVCISTEGVRLQAASWDAVQVRS